MNIEFEECVLEINGNQMVFEHPISSASTNGDLIYLIFDYSDFHIDRQANNLEYIDQAGNFVIDSLEKLDDTYALVPYCEDLFKSPEDIVPSRLAKYGKGLAGCPSNFFDMFRVEN